MSYRHRSVLRAVASLDPPASHERHEAAYRAALPSLEEGVQTERRARPEELRKIGARALTAYIGEEADHSGKPQSRTCLPTRVRFFVPIM